MLSRATSWALLLAALLSFPRAVASPEPPAATSEAQELRKALDELRRRVEALEAAGKVARSDVDEVKRLLGEAEKRIQALEAKPAAQPAQADAPAPAAAGAAAAPPPSAAETTAEALPAEGVDRRQTKAQLDLAPPEKPKPADWRRYLPDFYGSLRVRLGMANTGDVEVVDQVSRVGLQGKAPIVGKVSAIGRLELGVNLVNQNPKYIIGPGGEVVVGQGANPVTTRLGFVGLETPIGTFSYGKQWSVYYWVAGVTDAFWTFGGEAAGAYPVGDGGISGTGRAEQATNWRHTIGPVDVGLQSQNRYRTVNDQKWGDTVGAALAVRLTPALRVGAAWNEVRDGIPEPGPNDPKEGDEAAVFAVLYEAGRFRGGLTFSPSRNHTADDKGRYLDTQGWELALQYDLDRSWQLLAGFNSLTPTDPSTSEYRILDAIGGLVYRFGKELLLTGEVRLDRSRKADGGRLRPATVFAVGMNYGW